MARPTHTKPDSNQAEIVNELRFLGFDVDIICDLPGLYDLVVSGNKWIQEFKRTIPAVSVRVEVKAEDCLMTDNEIDYYDRQQNPNSYIVAHNAQDVIDWFVK